MKNKKKVIITPDKAKETLNNWKRLEDRDSETAPNVVKWEASAPVTEEDIDKYA